MKQRKIIRRESDYYPTPAAISDRIVNECVIGSLSRVLEPSAGSGSFVRSCVKYLPNCSIVALEPDAQFSDELAATGAKVVQRTLEEFKTLEPFDLIIGNPPYSHAEDHVRLCLDLLSPGGRLVFLLRLAFLESQGRKKLWQEHPPAQVDVFHSRPSFTSNGKTDSAAYAVFTWIQGNTEPPRLGWL